MGEVLVGQMAVWVLWEGEVEVVYQREVLFASRPLRGFVEIE